MKHNTSDHRLLIRTLFSTLVATDIDSVGPDAEVMILRQAIFLYLLRPMSRVYLLVLAGSYLWV